PDERVLFIERRGGVNLYKPKTGKVTRIATIPVSTKYADSSQAEDGLLGLTIDPNFAKNGWVYMYYSPAGPEAKNVIARFHMQGDTLHMASKQVLLEVGTQRLQCCHTGGSMAFDAKGNLYVSAGDNSNPFFSGYAPLDERPGRMPWDAQKSSGNTNDLRGKILRIRSTLRRITRVSTICRRRVAPSSITHMPHRPSSRSWAQVGAQPRRVPCSIAAISAGRRDHSRSITTASCSSTSSCVTGSW